MLEMENPPEFSDASPGAAFIPAWKLITPKQSFNDSRLEIPILPGKGEAVPVGGCGEELLMASFN